MSSITNFIKLHYRHFNAAALVDAALGYNQLLASGGKMFVTIAGAMSTAELGISLAEMNRVTDTCIPEMEAMRRIEAVVLEEWVAADKAGQRFFPHEFMFKILRSGKLEKSYQIDP